MVVALAPFAAVSESPIAPTTSMSFGFNLWTDVGFGLELVPTLHVNKARGLSSPRRPTFFSLTFEACLRMRLT